MLEAIENVLFPNKHQLTQGKMMTVITKKNEKVAQVVLSLPDGFTLEHFIEAFKVAHPKDWEKLNREYQKHERKTKPGKSHPMPHPEQYLKNALHVHQSSAR